MKNVNWDILKSKIKKLEIKMRNKFLSTEQIIKLWQNYSYLREYAKIFLLRIIFEIKLKC